MVPVAIRVTLWGALALSVTAGADHGCLRCDRRQIALRPLARTETKWIRRDQQLECCEQGTNALRLVGAVKSTGDRAKVRISAFLSAMS